MPEEPKTPHELKTYHEKVANNEVIIGVDISGSDKKGPIPLPNAPNGNKRNLYC